MPSSAEVLDYRLAHVEDEPAILASMRDFYAEEHLVFDELIAKRAVGELLAHPQFGRILLLQSGEKMVGHATLTFGFSLEFHGRYALLDELYLIPAVRGRGWGHLAVKFLTAIARAHGVATLRMEVSHANARARAVYIKAGFQDDRRDLFTRWITPQTSSLA
jgi:ribosomal protein S18 acetylase RimI-like enzyme